jgi:hypothetical protein
VLRSEWSIILARLLSSILLGQFRHEVTILVIAFQMASTRGLLKSEDMIVMNVGGNGTIPCVTIKPLIHTVRVVLKRRNRNTTNKQIK